VTVGELYEEWTRKKVTEVTPFTMKAHRDGTLLDRQRARRRPSDAAS
jgi:hypothetical protein